MKKGGKKDQPSREAIIKIFPEMVEGLGFTGSTLKVILVSVEPAGKGATFHPRIIKGRHVVKHGIL